MVRLFLPQNRSLCETGTSACCSEQSTRYRYLASKSLVFVPSCLAIFCKTRRETATFFWGDSSVRASTVLSAQVCNRDIKKPVLDVKHVSKEVLDLLDSLYSRPEPSMSMLVKVHAHGSTDPTSMLVTVCNAIRVLR